MPMKNAEAFPRKVIARPMTISNVEKRVTVLETWNRKASTSCTSTTPISTRRVHFLPSRMNQPAPPVTRPRRIRMTEKTSSVVLYDDNAASDRVGSVIFRQLLGSAAGARGVVGPAVGVATVVGTAVPMPPTLSHCLTALV